ncbi:DUF4386 family protein [Nocardia beijingensis]|uniref:DUF4386 family protein n=1 Tax=Nocardia beijingensis TaxID=95162 RepID=UPI000829F8B0|nr:DUF4386 family protein [Nocardia beijingensis]
MPARPWPTIALLVAAPITLNLAFAGLGSAFDYPHVLGEPAADVLASFRHNQTAVVLWFVVLAVAAAALGPLAVLIGRLDRSPAMRAAVATGVAAAAVQAIGLARWPVAVPALAARAAEEGADSSAVRTFEVLGAVLGTGLGETAGYTLTAAWTALVAVALRRRLPTAWTALGYVCALLVLSGVLVPLHVPFTALANFAGYVLWSVWLLTFAALLVRHPAASAARHASAPAQPLGAPGPR